MTGGATASDMGYGLAIVLAVVSVLGAAATYLGHGDHLVAGGGFGVAVLAAALAIAALHVYEP